MKFLFLCLVLSFQNSFAKKFDNMKLAKKLSKVTGVQIDMNVDTDDHCVGEQADKLLDQIKKFKSVTRKNFKTYMENHFNSLVFSPSKKVGSTSGSLGEITLFEEDLSMYNPKVITKRIVWDTRKYEGGENKNEFEIENGKVKFKIRSADNRFLKYDFYVFQKRLNDQGRIMEMENWSERFRHPFDIVSGIEASDEYSKKEMGSFECGSPINWFDLGFEASF